MAGFTQSKRPLRVTTPLGPDALLLTSFTGSEEVSRLYQFQLELLRPLAKGPVPFDQVLGQPASIGLELPKEKWRHFHGIINRFSQGKIVKLSQNADETFIQYKAEIVPQFWLLTKKTQSRIFQHKTVPDILKEVLTGLKVTFNLTGTWQPRDYCVQYRESDFDFASRLMEEEGIFYFFKHSADGHEMVVVNGAAGHLDLPVEKKLIYEDVVGGNREDQRILRWDKIQEIRSGKVTLFDHSFEVPHKHLEADKTIVDTVTVGTITHKLKYGDVAKLEQYDFPGGYAQRFDGIDAGGSPQPSEVQKIFNDNKRTVELRMQEEAAEAIIIDGGGNCGQMSAGHKFTLERHFDANGDYILTSVEHTARMGANYRTGEGDSYSYQNRFQCIPAAVPFRPERTTERPTVAGSQTAVVVGPAGEEIFTDQYGRVKVQFHWDRQGKNDANSSCWIRVGSNWAGKQWGMIHIPRIGQEVIVDFLEGDPDQPIIVGSVYNAEQMPPWALPANKTQSGIQTRSSLGGSAANFNQIRFEDKKGAEQLHIHAEKNQDIEVENDETHSVGHDRTKTIGHDETTLVKNDRTETVNNNETITVDGDRKETVHKNESITVDSNRTRAVGGSESVTVAMARTHTVGINEAITVGGAQEVTVGAFRAVSVGGFLSYAVGADRSTVIGGNQSEKIAKKLTVNIGKDREETVGGKRVDNIKKEFNVLVNEAMMFGVEKDWLANVKKAIQFEAADEIVFKTGDASITMKKDGTIIIKGKDIQLDGSGKINVKADGDIVLKGSKINQN
jgi:type VI secretion system secreted protein VgrG